MRQPDPIHTRTSIGGAGRSLPDNSTPPPMPRLSPFTPQALRRAPSSARATQHPPHGVPRLAPLNIPSRVPQRAVDPTRTTRRPAPITSPARETQHAPHDL